MYTHLLDVALLSRLYSCIISSGMSLSLIWQIWVVLVMYEVELGKIDGHESCGWCGNDTVEEYLDE